MINAFWLILLLIESVLRCSPTVSCDVFVHIIDLRNRCDAVAEVLIIDHDNE